MTDPAQPQQNSAATGGAGNVVVPPDIQSRFPDLVELILHSESMNDEERQYWLNILPIMTPEQLQNLRDILDNEKKQLASIDAKYSTQIDQASSAEAVKQTDEERRKRREERQTQETAHREEEEKAAEALLQQVVRQRVAGRPEAHDEDVLAVVGQWVRPPWYVRANYDQRAA